ncbi:hypothetical protein TcasGA2_TC000352 [Tribolium castaneum]|uniref:Uncharacterized protein n=1 Tax=Tribolium castaneum TaxID=7070 RepID=D6WAR9_TRICA|nr:hypothetical protein TcasGA2_TC000352 [Tribolium castaneum]
MTVHDDPIQDYSGCGHGQYDNYQRRRGRRTPDCTRVQPARRDVDADTPCGSSDHSRKAPKPCLHTLIPNSF